MFDRDGAFVVMRLEQVCDDSQVQIVCYIDAVYSYYLYHLAQKLYLLLPLYQHKADSYGETVLG